MWGRAKKHRYPESLTGLCLIIFAATTAASEPRWQQFESVTLLPNSSAVVLVEQLGADLALQIQGRNGIISTQDGPDLAFGTEVALLKNPLTRNAYFQVKLAPVQIGMKPRYSLTLLRDPSDTDQAIAELLSKANSLWYEGSDSEAVLDVLDKAPTGSAYERLKSALLNVYVDVLMRSGRTAEAIAFLQKNFPLLNSPPDGSDFDSYARLNLANAYWQTLQFDAAYNEASRLALALHSSDVRHPVAETRTRNWLRAKADASFGAITVFVGRARNDKKLMESGGSVLLTALRSVENSTDLSLRAQLTEYLASYYMSVLDRTNSVTTGLYREAAALYEQAGDRLNLASIRNNEAYAELGRGNVEAALRLYLETTALQQTSRQIEGKAHVRARLGYLYYTLGDYRRAETRFVESIEMYRQLNLPRKLIHNQLELTEIVRAVGKKREALKILVDIETAYGHELPLEDRVRLSTQISAIHLDQSDLLGAEKSIAQLGELDKFDSRNWQTLRSSIRLYFLLELETVRVRMEMLKGNAKAAGERIDRALAWLGNGEQEPLQQLQLIYLKMQIAKQSKNHLEFVRTGDRALLLVESIREKIDYHTQGPAWTARTNYIIDSMVAHFLSRFQEAGDRRDLDRAFKQLQSVRARNLRDARAQRLRATDTAVQAESRKAMQATNQELIRALLLEQSSEPIERRLARAEERFQLENKPTSSVPPPPVLGIDEIRTRLDADTQVRALFSDSAASFMIVAGRDYVRVIQLPGEAALRTLVLDAGKEMQLGRTEFPITRKLAELLFPSDVDLPKASKVLVESDGIFSGVPYSVLLSLQANGQSTPAAAVTPSLSELFASAAGNPAKEKKSLAIFADPAFSLSTEPVANRFVDTQRSGLGRLPYTRVEAESVSSYFPKDRLVSFIGTSATIDNVTSGAARNARILHIAAHGFASADDPFLIGLAMANSSSRADSGLLTMDHINAARFDNELVILSACESARGQLLNGEGLMSVARSFLASGAKATLSTLWPVPDRANAEFMKAFYHALTRLQYDAARSLTYAQQQMRQNAQYRHPYYWGAFVLHVVDARYQPVVSSGGRDRRVALN